MSDLRNVTATAFVGPGTPMGLSEPREFISVSGGISRTGWILRIGGVQEIHFHFEEPADLDRLAELLASRGAR